MIVKQVSVFVENRAGRLAEVTGILAAQNVNIRALSLADTADFGILRMIVDDAERAKAVLKKEGLTVGEADVVAVEVPDRPGGLAHLLQIFKDENLNVEYMYAFVKSPAQSAVMIFRFEDPHKAIEALQGKGIRTIPGDELYHL